MIDAVACSLGHTLSHYENEDRRNDYSHKELKKQGNYTFTHMGQV